MKKILRALPIILLLIAVGFFIGLTDIQKESKIVPSYNKSFTKIGTLIKNNEGHVDFKTVNLFSFNANRSNPNAFASKSVSLTLDKNALRSILSSREKSITLTIPQGDAAPMELDLIEQKVFSDNSNVYTLSGNAKTKFNFTQGLTYTGAIKGKENSLASISIFEDFVMGVISDESGNYVLGSVKEGNNYTDNYIFYNDNDLKVLNRFKCSIENEQTYAKHSAQKVEKSRGENPGIDARLTVQIYFECDYEMYLDFNSSQQNVVNYITGMFNSVKTIYQNEGIPTGISDIGVWTAVDPYRGLADNELILTTFGNNTEDDFQGNFAQLLSTRTDTDGGGIAWIDVFCIPYQQDGSGRYSFCFIDPTYSVYPVYSWTTTVVTHELGHNMGSYHTHACHWPTNAFNNGAIDSCYFAEGTCFNGTRASNKGTIMSYCHLNGSINLLLGFGQFPGDTIFTKYVTAPCTGQLVNSSEQPIVYDLKQNFPNPFNPSTTIRFLVPQDAIVSLKVYDISGKEIASLINNASYITGFYDVAFNSSVYNLPSGPYFYKMTAVPVSGGNAFVQVKKMILIK